MKVVLERMNKAVHFNASAGDHHGISIDGASSVGGEEKGMRPMEVLLSALGACSSIDVVSILHRQRQTIDDMRLEVQGDREVGAIPAVFKKIHLHFEFKGRLDDGKVRRAIDLSLSKYCSVAKMIDGVATITSSFAIK